MTTDRQHRPQCGFDSVETSGSAIGYIVEPRSGGAAGAWAATVVPTLSGVAGRAAAIIGLILASLPMMLTALIVWRELGLPIMFEQVRVGRDKQTFRLLKFRTMHDRRDADGAVLPDAERETSITRWLRRLRLDELPQLLAIAGGRMSFIGPRPLLPETICSFGDLGTLRCSIRPGLTGWSQINGNTKLSDQEKLALDVWYIKNRDWFVDLKIIFGTIRMLLIGETVDRHNLKEALDFVKELMKHLDGDGDQ